MANPRSLAAELLAASYRGERHAVAIDSDDLGEVVTALAAAAASLLEAVVKQDPRVSPEDRYAAAEKVQEMLWDNMERDALFRDLGVATDEPG